jgi:hypothetical protein
LNIYLQSDYFLFGKIICFIVDLTLIGTLR